jgi:hypothetical protein
VIRRPTAGQHEHASVVAMACPGVEQVGARAALAAERRQRALAIRIVVIERA